MPRKQRNTIQTARTVRTVRRPAASQPRRRPRARVVSTTSVVVRPRRKRKKPVKLQQSVRPARQTGMRNVSDGLNYMRTIHNGSVIEDRFQVRREKVANIVGSTSLSLVNRVSMYLNPGNQSLFPIFSKTAACYEKYRVNKLVFSYETEAYTASGSNVSAGKVILATNYDPTDPLFTSDTEMENYYNSDRGAPFCPIIHDVLRGDHANKDSPLRAYFVNPSQNTDAPDADAGSSKFFDVGLFQLGVQGNASGTAEIGELYVTYSFTMIGPKQPPSSSYTASSHFVGSGQTSAITFNGIEARKNSNCPITIEGNEIIFKRVGRYWITYLSTAYTTSYGTYGLGAGLRQVPQEGFGTLVPNGFRTYGSGQSTFAFFTIVDCISLAYSNMDLSFSINTGDKWDLFVTQVPDELASRPPSDSVQESQNERIAKLEQILSSLRLRNCELDSPIHVEHEHEEILLSSSSTPIGSGRILQLPPRKK